MSRAWRASIWALGIGLAACAGAPSSSRDRGATSSATSSAQASASSSAAPDNAPQSTDPSGAEPSGPKLDLGAVARLADDPRLARALTEQAAGHPLEAARAAAEARRAVFADAAATDEQRAAFAFFEASSFESAGVADAALSAFERVPASTSLAPFAALRAAALAASLGKPADALAKLATIEDGRVPAAKRDAISLEPLARTGALTELAAASERLFTSRARPGDWPASFLRAARVLRNTPTLDAARAALALLDRVRYDAPRGRGEGDAADLIKELASRLPHDEEQAISSPSLEVLASRGERLLAAEQPKRALTLLEKAAARKDVSSAEAALRCRLALAYGRALDTTKRRREAYDELERAVTACSGSDRAGEALLTAGRVALRAKLPDDATRLLGRFEAAFPTDARADEARLDHARAELAAGHRDRFRALLFAMSEDFPNGDSAHEALFTAAYEAIERGAWSDAVEPLERGAKLPVETVYYRAGRFTYYLGRAREKLGDRAAAITAYEDTLAGAPLSFYAALAFVHLEALAPSRGAAWLEKALAAEPTAALPELSAASAKDPRVAAALALAAVGDAASLADALAVLGVADHTADEATLWLGARLFAMAGDTRAAHQVLRTARERSTSGERHELTLLATAMPVGALRAAWELSFPRPFSREVELASRESDVPVDWLYAIMREESAFSPTAVSVAGARGLLQVMPGTGAASAKTMGLAFDENKLDEPEFNVRLGAHYIGFLRRRFAVAPVLAVPGYNAGPGAPERWLEERPEWDFDLWVEAIPYTETRNYLKRVWSSYFIYRVLGSGADIGEISATPLVLPPYKKPVR
ncbi:MAG: transglycosylase SLT domain-containing protein [Polyangiaceae bacterium]